MLLRQCGSVYYRRCMGYTARNDEIRDNVARMRASHVFLTMLLSTIRRIASDLLAHPVADGSIYPARPGNQAIA
jgi:hypothetical protein